MKVNLSFNLQNTDKKFQHIEVGFKIQKFENNAHSQDLYSINIHWRC